MKSISIRRLGILALALAVAGFVAPTAAVAQSDQGLEHGRGHDKDRDQDNRGNRNASDQDHRNGGDQDHDRDRNGGDNPYANNQSYQQGLNQGQNDRQQNRSRRYRFNSYNDQDRRAYQAGYDRGYESWNGLRGERGNDQFGQNSNPGFRMGYTDGSTDGQNDRRLNRQQKYGLGYKHPDRGYSSLYGDKNLYKQQYRAGYERGYNEGYGGR